MKKISQAEYNRRGQKAAATKAANKLAAQTSLKKVVKKVTKISIKRTPEQIKADNKAFNKLTPAKKRVAVAKDVIAQIQAGKYKPNNRGYINGLRDLDDDLDVQQLSLNGKLPECEVCGLGACILSIARLGDSLKVSDVTKLNRDPDTAYEANDKMLEIFGADIATMIETAFEGDAQDIYPWSQTLQDGNNTYYNEVDNIEGASQYFNNYRNPSKRLIAIMENIIKNKGKFVPEFSNDITDSSWY